MRLHFYLFLVFAMLFGNYALATDRVQFQIVAEEEGAFVNYQFHVGGFQNIVGAQGTFTWDPDSIQFIEIADINVPGMNMSDFNTFNTDNGQIFFAWFTFGNGVTLEDCSTIFTLRFAILEGIAQIKSSKVPVPFEFTNSDLQRLEATDIQVDECDFSSSLSVLKNADLSIFPNPVTAGDALHLELPVDISGFDWKLLAIDGKLIRKGEIRTTSEQSIVIPGDLPPGLYLLELSHKSIFSTHRLVIL
jgi:hypothetical protein